MRKFLPLLFVLWASVASGQTTVVKLCTSVGSGCDALPTMSNLNAAVITAAALSTPTNIYLQNGATFTGMLILRHRAPGVTAWITIRSGVDSAGNLTSSSLWPDATTRLWPPSYTGNTNLSGHATNYTGSLAKLISPGTNEETVRTVYPAETGSGCAAAPCVASYYKLELLDISAPVPPNVANGVIIALGSQQTAGGVPGGDTQNTAAEEAHHLTLSQIYVHGTDAGGCLHGIMQAARSVVIQHSYISNCWSSESGDAQAIWTINSTEGPTLTNNYVESSGENYLAGGDTPRMHFGGAAGITLSASSPTSATLQAALPDYMRVGDCVAVQRSGAKWEACISDIQPSGGNPRRLISFSPALAFSPDVPGLMTGNVVPRGATITGNWFNTPLAWRNTPKGTRKNNFELKIGRDFVITGNLMTNTWEANQTGVSVLFTPLHENNLEDSTQLANITFSYNRIQHATGCITITGTTAQGGFSIRTDGVHISHVSCEDISQTTWGNGSEDYFPGFPIGVGGHTPLRQYPKNVTIDHLYMDQRAGSSLFLIASDASTAGMVAATVKMEGFTLKNSILRNAAGYPYGFYDANEYEGHNSGVDTWTAVVSGGICQNNAWGAEPSAQWAFCTGTVFPTNGQIDAALVDHAAGDFSVDQGCGAPGPTCFDGAATDGSDLGPNWNILLDYYQDALNGTTGGGETPPTEPPPTPPGVIEELTIDNIYSPTARNLVLVPTADLILNPTGKDVVPAAGYDINLGRNTRKFLTGHFAEIWSSLLVALDVMSTIGGRVMVAPTTVLTSDLGAGDTTIAVKHNNLNNGDRLYLEGGLQVEFMSVTSSASGSGPFTYSVARSTDPTGPNDWSAGDAVVNTGTVGNGFIDLYSVRGAHAATEIGPSIVFNQRVGTAYNAWEPRAAIGNLDGLYGFSGSTYGMAAGVPGGARFTLTPATGLTIYGGDNDPKVTIDAVGNATFDGSLTVGTGRNMIRNSECRVSTDDWAVYIDHGLETFLSRNLAGWRLNNQSGTCYAAVTGVPGSGTPGTVTNLYHAPYMPVLGGARYEASAYIGQHRTASAAVMILWYDGYDTSAATIGAATGTTCTPASIGGAALTQYCRSHIIATAPLGAVTARMQVSVTYNGKDADPYLFMVRSYFGEAGPAQERPTPWGAAGLTSINNGLIETEAINARTIAARSITADRIEGDTITSFELGPSSVTAEQLAANSVTAAAILSGTITGTQIAGGTITTSHIAANSINSTHIQAGSVDADKMNVSSLSAISANLGSVVAGSITGVTINGGTVNGTTINGGTAVFGTGGEVTIGSNGLTLSGGTGTNNRIKWTGGHEMWGTTGGIYTNGSFSIEDVLVVGGQGSGAVDLSVDDIGIATSIQFANMPISTGTAVIWENACGCLKKVSSSARYKERIRPWFATDAQRLLNVTPIAFDYRGEGAKGVVGLSAEDLYLVAPDAVNLDAQGRPDSIRQDAVNAYLIQIIKELRDEIAALKARTK